MRLYCLFVVKLVFVFCFFSNYCFPDVPANINPLETLTKEIFNEQVVSSWHLLAAAVENDYSGTIELRIVGPPDKSRIARRIDFVQKKGQVRSESWIQNDKSKNLEKHRVSCSNLRYCFSLRGQRDDESWKVGDVLKVGSDAGTNPVMQMEHDTGAFLVTRRSYSILGVPFWELIRDKDFILSNIRYVDPEKTIVCIDFSWKLPDFLATAISGFSNPIKGVVEFNTRKHWRVEKMFIVLVRHQSGQQSTVYTDTFLEYSENDNAIPYVVKLINYKSNTRGGERKEPHLVYELSNVNFNPIDDKEFTLSHYGLPEPDFGERSVGWLRYILMTTGGLLIIYALWRMFRERKEKQQ